MQERQRTRGRMLTCCRSRSAQPPLSDRLRKLWSERGDFSRFKVSTLSDPSKAQEKEEQREGESAWDLGANLQGLLETEGSNGIGEEGESAARIEGRPSEQDGSSDVMSIQEMLQLRSRMLEKLGAAQSALYFSHALVSLLINSTKADQGSASNPSAARAGSPTSSSAGMARGDTAASTSARQRNATAMNVMGSAANLEAELGIEPHVFGASRLETERRDVNPQDSLDEAEDEEEQNDEDEDEEDLEKEVKRKKLGDKKMSEGEREERVRELVDCYEGKRQGLSQATDILRRGARALRGNEERNKREEMRWQLLLQAKRTGWGLTPDKPVRGAASNKRELLEDGNRKRDEPSRDAWIGYAVPEAHAAYRRRALAYFSHKTTTAVASPVEALAFASRSRKTLRVHLVVGDEEWTSGRRGEAKEEDADNSIEGQLRCAQHELADKELFDGIVAECRTMASSSLFEATIDDEDGVSIALTGAIIFIELRQDDKDPLAEEKHTDKVKGQPYPSALADAVAAILRLGLVRHYRARAGVKTEPVSAARKGWQDGVQMPLLLPILGLIHFASFVSRLQATLDGVKRADPRKDYELHSLEKVQDCQRWLALLLWGSHDLSSAEAMDSLGGSATVFSDGEAVAFLTISYPSNLSLSLPTKKNCVGGRGVQLSRIDVRTLAAVLSEPLQ